MKYTILTLTLLLSITITGVLNTTLPAVQHLCSPLHLQKSGTLPVRMVQSFEHRKLRSVLQGSVNITLPFEKNGQFRNILLQHDRKLVYRKTDYRESSFSLPTARFANGIYFVRVLVAGKSYSHRFVVTQ